MSAHRARPLLAACVLLAHLLLAAKPVLATGSVVSPSLSVSRLIIELALPAMAARGNSLGGAADGADATVRQAMLREHMLARSEITAIAPQARVEREYWQVINGFCLTLPSDDTSEFERQIAALPGIKRVYRETAYTTALYGSAGEIGADQLWPSLGGRSQAGRGVRIAVIDSGIRPDHPAFDSAGYAYPSGFPKGDGRYVTPKIIAARAYFRPSDPPAAGEDSPLPGPYGSSHGTTVAGIAAGNLVQANYRGLNVPLSGVAPAAYLMNYRVFYPTAPGAQEYAYSSEILAALDDAVADGADVIISSWCSVAARLPIDSPVAQALDAAMDAGCVVVAPAANQGPGVGSASLLPGGMERVLTVGAVSKSQVVTYDLMDVLDPTPVDEHLVGIPFARALYGTMVETISAPQQALPVAWLASDQSPYACNPLPQGSLQGHVAIALRGGCDFATKTVVAQQAGAAGMVLINDSDAVEPMGCLGDLCLPGVVTIPSIMIGQTAGSHLLSWLQLYPAAQVRLDPSARIVTATAGIVMPASGRGPAFMRYLKPDLVAPGVEVLAPAYLSGSEMLYESMTGTSIAAAHMAGAAALLLQAHPTWGHDQVKAALVGTSHTDGLVLQDGSQPMLTDVGAGLANVYRAASTPLSASPVSLSVPRLAPGAQTNLNLVLRDVRATGTNKNYSVSVTSSTGIQVTTDTTIALAPGGSREMAVLIRAASSAALGSAEAVLTFSSGADQITVPIWLNVQAPLVGSPLLVIDNDFSNFEGYRDYAPWLLQAMNQLGLSYAYWDADLIFDQPTTLPSVEELARYAAIIWLTGDHQHADGYYMLSTPLTTRDQQRLAAYLDGGGRLLAFGQNLAQATDVNQHDDETWGRSPLYHGYLGAHWLQGAFYGGQLPPSSGPAAIGLPGTFLRGVQLSLGSGGDGAANQTSVDEIAPGGLQDGSDLDLVQPVLVGVDGQPQGEGYLGLAKASRPTLDQPQNAIAYRTLYYSFGIEGVNTTVATTSRSMLIAESLRWLLDVVAVEMDPVASSINALTTISCRPTSSHGGDSLTYRWRVGQGSTAWETTSTAPSIVHNFEATGIFPVAVEVVDSLGHSAVATSTVEIIAGGTSTLTVDRYSAQPGQQITYDLTVRNTAAYPVQASLRLPLPPHTSYVSHQGGNYAGGQLSWSGTLAAESQYTARLVVRVRDGTANGAEILGLAQFQAGGDVFTRQVMTRITPPLFLPVVAK